MGPLFCLQLVCLAVTTVFAQESSNQTMTTEIQLDPLFTNTTTLPPGLSQTPSTTLTTNQISQTNTRYHERTAVTINPLTQNSDGEMDTTKNVETIDNLITKPSTKIIKSEDVGVLETVTTMDSVDVTKSLSTTEQAVLKPTELVSDSTTKAPVITIARIQQDPLGPTSSKLPPKETLSTTGTSRSSTFPHLHQTSPIRPIDKDTLSSVVSISQGRIEKDTFSTLPLTESLISTTLLYDKTRGVKSPIAPTTPTQSTPMEYIKHKKDRNKENEVIEKENATHAVIRSTPPTKRIPEKYSEQTMNTTLSLTFSTAKPMSQTALSQDVFPPPVTKKIEQTKPIQVTTTPSYIIKTSKRTSTIQPSANGRTLTTILIPQLKTTVHEKEIKSCIYNTRIPLATPPVASSYSSTAGNIPFSEEDITQITTGQPTIGSVTDITSTTLQSGKAKTSSPFQTFSTTNTETVTSEETKATTAMPQIKTETLTLLPNPPSSISDTMQSITPSQELQTLRNTTEIGLVDYYFHHLHEHDDKNKNEEGDENTTLTPKSGENDVDEDHMHSDKISKGHPMSTPVSSLTTPVTMLSTTSLREAQPTSEVTIQSKTSAADEKQTKIASSSSFATTLTSSTTQIPAKIIPTRRRLENTSASTMTTIKKANFVTKFPLKNITEKSNKTEISDNDNIPGKILTTKSIWKTPPTSYTTPKTIDIVTEKARSTAKTTDLEVSLKQAVSILTTSITAVPTDTTTVKEVQTTSSTPFQHLPSASTLSPTVQPATIPEASVAFPSSTPTIPRSMITLKALKPTESPELPELYIRLYIQMNKFDLCVERGTLKDSLVVLVGDAINPDKKVIIMSKQITLKPLDDTCKGAWRRKRDTKIHKVDTFMMDFDGEYSYENTNILAIALIKLGTAAFVNTPFEATVKDIKVHGDVNIQDTSKTLLVAVDGTKPLGVGAIIGIIFAGFIFVALTAIFGLIIATKWRRRGIKTMRHVTVNASNRPSLNLDATSLAESIQMQAFQRRSSSGRYLGHANVSMEDNDLTSNPLSFEDLEFIQKCPDVMEDEFIMLPNNLSSLSDLPENVEDKNRYANVIPNPETRVPLEIGVKEGACSYINANFIRGYQGYPKCYIATQAPLEATLYDFWRMVWEQNTTVIIMLTGLTENNIEKCNEYWPNTEGGDTTRLYGEFRISQERRIVMPEYIQTTLQVRYKKAKQQKQIQHFWLTAWPSHGLPDYRTLIKFMVKIRPIMDESTAPPVIHCSPGTGRTGVFIALDIAMLSYEDSLIINVLNIVHQMRNDRGGMVQTREQYAFIYKVMYEFAKMLNNPVSSARSSITSTTSSYY